MSADSDDPKRKKEADATRIGGMPPPAERPGSTPPAAPDADGTRIAPSVAPPRPAAPPSAPEAEGTRIGPAVAPPRSPDTAPPAAEADGTRIAPAVAPPRRAEPAGAPEADGTRIGGAPPPRPVATPPPAAGGDQTRVVPAAPPAAPSPAGKPPEGGAPAPSAGTPPPASDATRVLPRRDATGAADAAGAPETSRTIGTPDQSQDATVFVAPTPAAQAAQIERIAPKDKRQMLDLSQSTYVFGRSRSADIQLYTATASREHARLVRQGGRWAIEPIAHKIVLAGGIRVTRGTVQLTHKMRLKMGEDEFLFLDESAPPSEPEVGRTWWSRVLAWLSRWAPKAGG